MPNRMEEMASKGMAKAKEVKATVKGLKGVFKELASEHGEADALLRRIKSSSKPEVRAELFPVVRKELLAHERGELSELYPVLRNHQETRALADHHDREAEQMERMLSELSNLGYDSPQWESKFEKLVETVEHHAKEEENEYFPKAQEVLGEQKAEELGQRYLVKKKAIMQEL